MARNIDRTLIRSMLVTFLKLALLFGIVVFLLSRLPSEDEAVQSYGVAAAFVFLSIIYAIYFFFQLQGIRRAQHPGIRATEAMISTAFLFLAMFATIYTIISIGDPEAFTEEINPFTGLYVAITILSTVGFGDITPVSVPARSMVMIQMALGLVYLGLVVKVFAGAAKSRNKNKTREGGTEHSDPRG
jgi:voltage-gated potassium channel